MSVENMTGWWMQDSVQGNVTEWLSSENVGFLMRQAAWATGYGKGKNKLGLLVQGDKIYIQQELDMAGRFRSSFQLGGEKQKIVMSEGAPLIPTRQAWIEGVKGSDGNSLEMTLWDESKEKKLREAKRTVSEDGKQMTTVAKMFLADGTEAMITTTHVRMDDEPLTADSVSSWCPVMVHGDAESPSNPDLKSAVTEPLETLFPSKEKLLECMVQVFKNKEKAPDESSVSYNEVSPTDFSNEVTKTDGSTYILKYEMDKESSLWKCALIAGGSEQVCFHFNVVTSPLRAEGWVIIPSGERHSSPAVGPLEDTIGAAVKHLKK